MTDEDGHSGGEASPGVRVERIITAGRIVVIACGLLALWLDPSATGLRALVGFVLLGVYLLYVVAVGSHVWLGRAPPPRLRAADQALEAGIGMLLLTITGGTSSAFFSYLSFPVLFATLRWQWRGALGAGAPLVLTFIVLGAVEIYGGVPRFETNTFIMRTGYLVALTGLLCYIAVHEQRARRAMLALMVWDSPSGVDQTHVAKLLESAGAALGARRAVIAWSDADGGPLHLAYWTGVEVDFWEDADATADDLVDESLAGVDFVSPDVATAQASIMWLANGRLNRQRATETVPTALRLRFAMRSVVAVRLQGALVRGRLFLLDLPHVALDDLLMAGLLARQIEGRLEYRLAARQLAETAAAEERIRLARNVHDGALQALTGIRLQLEAARRVATAWPEEAQAVLLELQEIVATEHRMLRLLVSRLQRAESGSTELEGGLAEMVAALAQRIERQWSVTVTVLTPIVNAEFEAVVPRLILAEVFHILREALVNAARHARATAITLNLALGDGAITMLIGDDGQGFPFTGRHDLRRLIRYDMGPAVIRERVAALGGSLTIDSSGSGARLEISIPVAPPARLSPRASSTER